MVAVFLLMSGCKKQTWDGYVYPNRHDLSKSDFVGTFNSEDECYGYAEDYLARKYFDGHVNEAVYHGDMECVKR